MKQPNIKDKLTVISDCLNQGIINELEAQKQLLILLSTTRNSEEIKEVYNIMGTWKQKI